MTDRIETNPAVMLGKPVVRNTRIPVELLLRKLADGASIAALLDAHPRLTEDDIRACLVYAADTIANEETYSLAAQGWAADEIQTGECCDCAVGQLRISGKSFPPQNQPLTQNDAAVALDARATIPDAATRALEEKINASNIKNDAPQ